jgi:hypothetical protein
MDTKTGYDRDNIKECIPEQLVFYETKSVNSLKQFTNYAFVVSPHVSDCHRTWEALCLGCIPIVKTSNFDYLYEGLPILIVKEWNDVTQELLNKTISDFKDKKFDYSKLTLKYWMNKINSYKIAVNTMKQKSVVIAGCCRSNERFMYNNLQIIDAIGSQFKEYKVVIYENDSNDNTRQILLDNKKSHYTYIFGNNIKIENRTERIAYCRNKILEEVTKEFTDYDYMLLLDLDDVLMTGRLIGTIHSCFLYNTNQWDAMFANCSDKYYDIYALRKKNYLMTCCWNDTNTMKYIGIPHHEAYNKCIDKYIINYPVYTKLIPVISAFGGAGLYKIKSITSLKNIKYIGYEENHIDKQVCEHVSFNTELVNNGYKLYINPKMLIR